MEKHCTATCYIFKDQKVLLVFHRKFNTWMPPGGHVDPNETPQDAAIRECLEETGLEVELVSEDHLVIDYPHAKTIARPYMCMLEEIPAHKEVPAHQHIDFIFLGRIRGGRLLCNETEHHAIRWFSYDELAEGVIPLFPEVRETLSKLMCQMI